jgi:hypothetical protein
MNKLKFLCDEFIVRSAKYIIIVFYIFGRYTEYSMVEKLAEKLKAVSNEKEPF